MAKLNVTFAEFSEIVKDLGAPQKATDSIFFIKTPTSGKVELNCNSSTYTVGSGSKFLDKVTASAVAAGFKVKKESKGWTILEFDTLERIKDLINAVQTSLTGEIQPKVKVEKVKTEKTKVEKEPVDDVEAIKKKNEVRQKNLEVMKSVSKKLGKQREYQAGKVAVEKNEGVEDFDPTLARAEVNAILASVDAVPKFLRNNY